MNSLKKQKGYTIIELLIYVAVLAFMMVVVVGSLVGISRVYRQVRIVELVHSNASSAVETVSREIRTALSVDAGASTFDSTNGVLKLNSIDLGGVDKTVTFSLSSGQILMSENGSSLGPITSDHATVSSLHFEHVDMLKADAVKFYITLSVGTGEYQRTETFYDTIVLRGSYDI